MLTTYVKIPPALEPYRSGPADLHGVGRAPQTPHVAVAARGTLGAAIL
jgi:hypothetical protein